jgi:hypothetical protein
LQVGTGVGAKHDPMNGNTTPLIVQYLYVHGQDEGFYYPTARAATSAAQVAARYLECALVQSASLRLRDVDCELVLATNIADRQELGPHGIELLEQLESLGVRVLPTEYRHRPGDDTETYVSSRYVLDAIMTATEGQPAERRLWLTDLDCVWVDAQRVFATTVPDGEVGCLHIRYPPDWDVVGFGGIGLTPTAIGELAASIGGPDGIPMWVGGELLTGTPTALRELVGACETIDSTLAERGQVLPTEEQVLSLAGAAGRVKFHDLSSVVQRISTGPRHRVVHPPDPLAAGLWHLPSEKGLSLRRTAQQIRRGRTARLRRDLADPRRTARRFNVGGTGYARRIRDDSWIIKERIRAAVRSTLDRR